MSTETLLLAGKPGTGKLAPGKVTPLKGVKAKPELTQQLVVKQAAPHTPEIPHWKGDFPFPKDIVYHDERDGKLIADLKMIVVPDKMEEPNGTWGEVEAMEGTSNPPKFSAESYRVKPLFGEETWRIGDVYYELRLRFGMVRFDSQKWESGWNPGMEQLTGRYGTTLEQRKYWCFQHEMDHFRAWSHMFRYMLNQIFKAINAEYKTKEEADRVIQGIRCNSPRNYLIGAIRSHAFDEDRCAPRSGGQYDAFTFPEGENFLWRPLQDEEEPVSSGYLEIALNEIKKRGKKQK